MIGSMIFPFALLAQIPLTWLFMLLLMLIALPLGIYLLITGMRGSRIDDHPICRTCRFDLTGKSDDRSTCPECGADLSASRGIIVGNRHHHRDKYWAGMVCVVICLGVIGAMGMRVCSQTHWLAMTPTWGLGVFLRFDGSHIKDVWIELTDRYEKKQLSSTQIDRLAQTCLAIQASPRQAWQIQAGRFLRTCFENKQLKTTYWQQYMDQATAGCNTYLVRSTIEHGQPFWVRWQLKRPMRLSEGHIRMIRLTATFYLDDQMLWDFPMETHTFISMDSYETYRKYLSQITDQKWQQIKPGKHNLVVKQRYQFCDDWAFRLDDHVFETLSSPVVVRDSVFTLPVMIVPQGQDTVEPVFDESKTQQMRDALEVERMQFNPKDGRLGCRIKVARPVYPMAFDVIARVGGKEFQLDVLIATPSTEEVVWKQFRIDSLKGVALSDVDLVLRPSVKTARRSVQITNYWNQPIVFERLPVSIRDTRSWHKP